MFGAGMPQAASAEDSSHTARPDRSGRILIVEDEFFIAVVNGDALVDAGHRLVGITATAEEAIAIARAERPDLVLMDIRLAGKRDGVDAAIEIFRTLGIRSIFTTANADAGTRARAEPARPLAWLPKPFSVGKLVAVVEDALAQTGTGSGPSM